MINTDDLLKIIEGRNVELKKAKNAVPDSFWETYSAFANTDGGSVIFGVDEKAKMVTGVEKPYKLRDDLLNTANNPQKVSVNLLSMDDLNSEDLEIYKKALYHQTKNEKYQNIQYEDMLIEIGAMRKDRQRDGNYYLTTGGLLFFGENSSIKRSEANDVLKMDNYAFRRTLEQLLEKDVIEVRGKGRATTYVLKLTTPEQSYSMKKILRSLEDNIVNRRSF
ncbi:MAG: ATP-binding protein [Peptostreptococcaceae bacterium]|nr:ATP-binding protein [Peptostreptococcaceae bacterium]